MYNVNRFMDEGDYALISRWNLAKDIMQSAEVVMDNQDHPNENYDAAYEEFFNQLAQLGMNVNQFKIAAFDNDYDRHEVIEHAWFWFYLTCPDSLDEGVPINV